MLNKQAFIGKKNFFKKTEMKEPMSLSITYLSGNTDFKSWLNKESGPPAWPWPASSAGILSAPLLPGSSSRHPHQPFSCSLSSPYPLDP